MRLRSAARRASRISAEKRVVMYDCDANRPLSAVLPDLVRCLETGNRAVLQAPPGAGKTTLVPPALAFRPGRRGRIVLLEPRRMAARAAARYMAARLGEPVGRTVGYRVRLEGRDCAETRILVVTEGILTRMIQDDPTLNGVDCLIFDEFHERSLHADLGLALALDCQNALREDLRILVMSATLDVDPLLHLLAPCPLVRCGGRSWPVETRHLPIPAGMEPERATASAVLQALNEASAGVLVFAPGVGELFKIHALLEDLNRQDIDLYPLYGELPPEMQDAALTPPKAGRRKVVLATSIAETSLTIEGIDAVVDMGLARSSRFDPGTGMSRLVTTRVSRAQAEQRRGRAGRNGPGLCLRLWSREQDATLQPFARPEILEEDLAPLVLESALWGVNDPASLHWLDTPPAATLAEARTLLQALGALDAKHRITSHGRNMAALGVHPRLAHMLLEAVRHGAIQPACLTAVLLEERDPLSGCAPGVDIRFRWSAVRETGDRGRNGRCLRLKEQARRLEERVRSITGTANEGTPELPEEDQAGLLLALAYPDRVAQQRGEKGRFRLRNGRGAFMPQDDPLATEPFVAVGAVEGSGRDARIRQAAPLPRALIDELFGGAQQERVSVVWDAREQAVLQRRIRTLDALVLREMPTAEAPEAEVRAAVIEGIRTLGLSCLPWTETLRQRRARVVFLHRLGRSTQISAPAEEADDGFGGEIFPDLSERRLLQNLEVWLEPFLNGIVRRADFRKIDLAAAFDALLPWTCARRLDKEAPGRIRVPSGSVVTLRYAEQFDAYGEPEPPVLAVKLQELFGLTVTPTVAEGRIPVRIQLLSPAGRPLQVTQDLAGFWKTGYPLVRAEMRGRYPKHPWPEDPLRAVPTARTTSAEARRRGGMNN